LRRFVPRDEFESVGNQIQNKGVWVVAICRSVPVLAEASSVVAGSFGLSWRLFLVVSALSNTGIAAVYALLGSLAMRMESLPLAFASSVLTPLLAIGMVKASRVFHGAGIGHPPKADALDNGMRAPYPGHR
jgi:membrane protein DedA with SNARE-associated domain